MRAASHLKFYPFRAVMPRIVGVLDDGYTVLVGVLPPTITGRAELSESEITRHIVRRMIRYCSAGHFITGTPVPESWESRHRSPRI